MKTGYIYKDGKLTFVWILGKRDYGIWGEYLVTDDETAIYGENEQYIFVVPCAELFLTERENE